MQVSEDAALLDHLGADTPSKVPGEGCARNMTSTSQSLNRPQPDTADRSVNRDSATNVTDLRIEHRDNLRRERQ